jgi:putative transposase
VARIHERIQAQRKDFAHQESRKLVRRFDLVALKSLSVKGLAAGMLAKSVQDAAWSLFTRFLAYKAANAGKQAIAVDPCGSSQECPACGRRARKSLSERRHHCPCGLRIDRDEASAQVILARALRVVGASACGSDDLCAGGSSPGVSRAKEAGSPQESTHS